MDLGVIHAVFLGLGSFDGVLYGKFFVLLGWKREKEREVLEVKRGRPGAFRESLVWGVQIL